MAATGSAVGLGNIWGFPTQAAGNGGAAFVLVYAVFTCLLAYPALMAELVIGRHTRHNIVAALPALTDNHYGKLIGRTAGLYGVIVASLILAFYAIVAGWMSAHIFAPAARIVRLDDAAQWLTEFGVTRNIIFTALFSTLTAAVVASGVRDGIERWSTRLMPTLLILILVLIGYVFTLEGALAGLRVYLIPDFSIISNPRLLTNAMGQAFFSLSLGVGSMLIYGSYLAKAANLPSTAAWVTAVDMGVAFIAGLLIVPAVYVAKAQGVQIFDDSGALIAGPNLILETLPLLFDSLGPVGVVVTFGFFVLMTIAALTSAISMLEVPVAFATERFQASRAQCTWITSAIIFTFSTLITTNFDALFAGVVDLTTKYSQPLLAAILCLFVGWIMHRERLLNEIRSGFPDVDFSWFWKIWPFYVRIVCPVLISILFVQAIVS